MDIKVDFNFLPFTKALKAAYKDQIPFAMSKAINKTAFQVRKATVDHLRTDFTIRRPYVLFGAAGRGGIRVNTPSLRANSFNERVVEIALAINQSNLSNKF